MGNLGTNSLRKENNIGNVRSGRSGLLIRKSHLQRRENNSMKRYLGPAQQAAGILIVLFATVLGASTVVCAQDTPTQTTDVQQMKDRLKQLEDTVRELKGQLDVIEEKKKTDTADAAAAASATPLPETPAKPAEVVPTDDTNGRTAMAIYGFAMLDAGYDFKTSNPNWFDVIRPTRLPSFGGEFAPNGKTYFGVRQSRLGVKTTTPTRFGDL